MRRLGGAAEVERRMRLLNGRKRNTGVFDTNVFARERHRFPGEKSRVNVQEFLRRAVTFGVGPEQAVPAVLLRIAAGNDIDQRAPIGQPIERRRHSRGLRRRHDAGPDRDEKPEPLGQRREGRGDQPAVLARAPGRDQHALEAEEVGGERDLLEIGEIPPARILRRTEIAAVAERREEPERADLVGSRHGRGILVIWGSPVGVGPSTAPIAARSWKTRSGGADLERGVRGLSPRRLRRAAVAATPR